MLVMVCQLKRDVLVTDAANATYIKNVSHCQQ